MACSSLFPSPFPQHTDEQFVTVWKIIQLQNYGVAVIIHFSGKQKKYYFKIMSLKQGRKLFRKLSVHSARCNWVTNNTGAQTVNIPLPFPPAGPEANLSATSPASSDVGCYIWLSYLNEHTMHVININFCSAK